MSHEQVVHLIQVKSLLVRDVYVSNEAALDDAISQPPCCLSQNILEQQESKDQTERIVRADQEYHLKATVLKSDSKT